MNEYAFAQKPALEDLEHYGTKGMKWGVRRTRRIQGHIDRVAAVREGTATRGQRVRVGLSSGIVTSRGAARALRRGARLQQTIQDGDAFALDLLTRMQGVRVRDLDYRQNN